MLWFPPDYKAYGEEYSAYAFREGQTNLAQRLYGEVDPVFYASVARYNNTTFYFTSTYDEWSGGDYTCIVRVVYSGMTGTRSTYNISPNYQNTNKKGVIALASANRVYTRVL